MGQLRARKNDEHVWPAGRYRLLQRSELPPAPGGERRIMEEGEEVVWDGMPGEHMDPLDDQAKANVKHVDDHMGGMKPLDPTMNLSLVIGEVDDANTKIAELNAQIQALQAAKAGAVATGGSPIKPPTKIRPGAAPPI